MLQDMVSSVVERLTRRSDIITEESIDAAVAAIAVMTSFRWLRPVQANMWDTAEECEEELQQQCMEWRMQGVDEKEPRDAERTPGALVALT